MAQAPPIQSEQPLLFHVLSIDLSTLEWDATSPVWEHGIAVLRGLVQRLSVEGLDVLSETLTASSKLHLSTMLALTK